MTTKKIVKNKLSKMIIVDKVESRWTSVNKWKTMAITAAVVYLFADIFINSYVNLSFFICQFYLSVCNYRVHTFFFISWSGSVSSYQCVIHFRGMACNQHVKINSFFPSNFQGWGPQLCDYCLQLYSSTNVRYVYLSDSQVSSVKWPVVIVLTNT